MESSQEKQEKMMKEFRKEVDLSKTMAYNMIYTLPITFVAKPNQSGKIKGDVTDARGALSKETEENVMKNLITFEEKYSVKELPKKIVFEKLDKKAVQHLKRLYIFAHIDGCPIKKVLIDNREAVNILPSRMLKILGKTEDDLIPIGITISSFVNTITSAKSVLPIKLVVETKKNTFVFFVVDSQSHFNALLRRDWIHSNLCVPSSLHQSLLFWNNVNVEKVQANIKPFLAEYNVSKAVFYHNNNVSNKPHKTFCERISF